jgi:hypothetical protein
MKRDMLDPFVSNFFIKKMGGFHLPAIPQIFFEPRIFADVEIEPDA